MPSTFTTRNRLEKQAPGENNNSWGTILNDNMIAVADQALDGMISFSLSTGKTLTTANGASDEARCRYINITGGTGGTVTLPNVEKVYVVHNAASGMATFTTGSGTTCTVPLGRAKLESDFRRAAYDQALQTALAETSRFQDVDLANAGLQTDVSKTNAGLTEQAEQRYLQAIGLLGELSNSYGANDRADLGLMAELGGIQRDIDSAHRNAVPAQLQLAGNLYGAVPPQAYIGQKTKSSGMGYVWDSIIDAAKAAASIASAVK